MVHGSVQSRILKNLCPSMLIREQFFIAELKLIYA